MRCTFPIVEPGGGGINVARGIHRLGGHVTAIYLASGYHGQLLNELLRKEEVDIAPIEIDGNTRESWTILEKSTNKQFRFLMPGPEINESAWLTCISKLELVPDIQYIVISGSVPDTIPKNFVEIIGAIAKEKNAKLIVDLSGESLLHAVKFGVYMIKPNLNELASLIVALGLTQKSMIAAAQEIIAMGKCEIVVVSIGAGGAVLVNKDVILEIKPPPVTVRSTVGAGDSMVAGIVQSLVEKRTLREALQYGVVCGTAATMNQGTALFDLDDVENLYALMQNDFLKNI